MATYPARGSVLFSSVSTIIDQLDHMVICCNEYKEIPEWMLSHPKIDARIPQRDLKDTGKFINTDYASDYTFYLDDDIVYPDNYVQHTVEEHLKLASTRSAVGYHGSWYSKPKFCLNPTKFKRWLGFMIRKSNPMWYRHVLNFQSRLDYTAPVEQLGTGVAAIPTEFAPDFSCFEGSQKFVDVRFAKWCFNNHVDLYCLRRNEGWLSSIAPNETIYDSFTIKSPRNVQKEIYAYASSLKL